MVQCFKHISFPGSERYVKMFFYCIWYDWQVYKCSSECLWAQCWSDVRCFDVGAFIAVHHSVVYMIDDWMDGWLVDWFVAGWWVQAEIDVHEACCASCGNAFPPRRAMNLGVFNLFMWEVYIF